MAHYPHFQLNAKMVGIVRQLAQAVPADGFQQILSSLPQESANNLARALQGQ